jgi:hypothetical protein
MLTWPAIAILFSFCLFSEYHDSTGFSFFWGLIAVVISLYVFNIPSEWIAYALYSYIPIGVLWSLWRWRRYCSSCLVTYQHEKKTYKHTPIEDLKASAIRTMNVTHNKGRITGWILGWPWSVIINLTKDIIKALEKIISVYLRKVFEAISSSARSEISNDKSKPDVRKD